MKQKKRKEKKESAYLLRRIITLTVIVLAFASFIGTLAYVQLVKGEDYAAAASASSGKDVVLPAARGEIFDRNGIPLIVNRQVYALVFEHAYFPKKEDYQERNTVILNLIRLFESKDAPWVDALPIIFDENGALVFAQESDADITYLKGKDLLDLNDYATAQNCMDALITLFHLEQFSLQDARKIASVWFNFNKQSFRISNPYTFAQDVPKDLIYAIKENSGDYPGVTETVIPYREYMVEGWLAPHILGRVGAMDQEDYDSLKDAGYGMDEIIGKSGIEAAMENYLRGKSGKKTVTVTSDGKALTDITQEPEQGNTVILTMDIQLQRVVYEALEKVMVKYRKNNSVPVPPAGAAVVMNCKNGEVLASVSYPSYDITTYAEQVQELSNDPQAPLWNRALMSTYSPGSTIKPSVALAGLEEGVIDGHSTVRCTGYFYLAGQRFQCLQGHANRNVNVVSSIAESCNIFYYDTGLKLGIEKMNEYRTLLGLGQKTGVELPEAVGMMDSPEFRKSLGQTWTQGLTVQGSIAQANNAFTAIQMTNYCATIANGGTRYVPHFVKSIRSSDYTKTVVEKNAEVAVETGISQNSIDLVKQGMWRVANTGSCSQYLKNVGAVAAAKTGTSQAYREGVGEINNGFLITFAPYDDPEIAMFIICEGFKGSIYVAEVAQYIYEYYFNLSGAAAAPQGENALLG